MPSRPSCSTPRIVPERRPDGASHTPLVDSGPLAPAATAEVASPVAAAPFAPAASAEVAPTAPLTTAASRVVLPGVVALVVPALEATVAAEAAGEDGAEQEGLPEVPGVPAAGHVLAPDGAAPEVVRPPGLVLRRPVVLLPADRHLLRCSELRPVTGHVRDLGA